MTNPSWPTSLGMLLLALTMSCSNAPQTATTPQVVGTEISYTDPDGTICRGYLAYDSNHEGQRPGVLVVHEWWGHNDYTRRRADMLAAMGYTAFALDMYGAGKHTEHPDQAGEFMQQALAERDVGVQRFRAARAILEQHPTTDPSRTAAIGYCFGGGVVLHMARTGADLRGVASFHGSLGADDRVTANQTRAEVLVCHGAEDQFTTAEQIAALKAELGDRLEFREYPDAQHGFTNPAADDKAREFGLPLGYHAAADSASWAALGEFLARVFG